MITPSKICKSCGEKKKVSLHFYKAPANRDGLNTRCITCIKVKNKIDYLVRLAS